MIERTPYRQMEEKLSKSRKRKSTEVIEMLEISTIWQGGA